jgi:hypothetical protein
MDNAEDVGVEEQVPAQEEGARGSRGGIGFSSNQSCKLAWSLGTIYEEDKVGK